MKRLYSVLSIISLASLGSQSVAQPGTATRIDRHRGAVPPSETERRGGNETAFRAMNTYARCVARNRPRLAEEILALPFRSEAQGEAARRAIGGEDGCLGSTGAQLRFQSPLLVGPMAEYFLTERLGERDLAPVTSLSAERLAEMGFFARGAYESFAVCVATRDPARVLALVRSRPFSEEETSAIERLTPHLSPCITSGATMTLNKAAVRSLVAVGLYRLLTAPVASVDNMPTERR